MTVPQLFAAAHGIECVGDNRCFFCGAPCAAQHPTAHFVKDSFTGRTEVRSPGSSWICNGCVLCLRESATCPMLDGTERVVTKCAMRTWSWLVTKGKVCAGSKANLECWRELCVKPPLPPFAIVLSDSGQKHLLYRGVVNHSQESIVVTLETEKIAYRPSDLASRLALCEYLIAATGKPAIAEPPTIRLGMAVLTRFRSRGEALLENWLRVQAEPLSRLAVWLSPNHERCAELHEPDTDNPAT